MRPDFLFNFMEGLLGCMMIAFIAVGFTDESQAEAGQNQTPAVKAGCLENLEGKSGSGAGLCDGPLIVAEFEAATQWLTGHDWGGEAFGGGLGKGCEFCPSPWGCGCYHTSSVLATEYTKVEIRFDADSATLCGTWVRDSCGLLVDQDSGAVGVFPGTAWDVSVPAAPRKLNLCFFNWVGDTLNPYWDPTEPNKWLHIMRSDYDGTGLTYAGTHVRFDSLDIMYILWPEIPTGHTFLETLPAVLHIIPNPLRRVRAIPDSSKVHLSWQFQGDGVDRYRIYSSTSSPPTTLIDSVPGSELIYLHTEVENGILLYYAVEAIGPADSVLAISHEVEVTPMVVSRDLDLVGAWNNLSDYGDIWGYVDSATGKEYALLCARDDGVSIIDVDVVPPLEVGFMPALIGGSTDVKDVKTYGHYAVIANEKEAIQIVDMADVTNPVVASTIEPDGGGCHNSLVDGDYLYVVGNHDVGGLEIFSILDPSSPVKVGDYQPYYYHDVAMRNDTLAAAAIYGEGVDLIDVTDKSNPQLIGQFNYSGSGAHNVEFSENGNYLFVGDEVGSAGKWTRVFDISNYSNITLAAEIIVDPGVTVHNCYQLDGLLYIAHYGLGVRVWNVVDPNNPFEVGYFNTTLAGSGLCWGVYPYLPSGKILASDMEQGLYVLDFIEPPGCCEGIRGNVDGDASGDINIADLVYVVDFMFSGGPESPCDEEADIDGSGELDIADLVYLVDYMFSGGSPPPVCP